jgi:hypothetical protein
MIVIPITITLIVFCIALWLSRGDGYQPASDFAAGIGMLIDGLVRLLFLAIAAVVSLVTWLVYVLLT